MDPQPPRSNTNPFVDSTEDSPGSESNPDVNPVNLNNYDLGNNQRVEATQGDGSSTHVDYNTGLNSDPNDVPNGAPPSGVPNYGFIYGANLGALSGENFSAHLGAMEHVQGQTTPYLIDSYSISYVMQAMALVTAIFLNVVFMNRHMLTQNITKSEFDEAVLGNHSTEEITPVQETTPIAEITPVQETSPIEEITPVQETTPIPDITPVQEYQPQNEILYSPVYNEWDNDDSATQPLLADEYYVYEPLSPQEGEEDDGNMSPEEGEYLVYEAEIENLMNMSYEHHRDSYTANLFDELNNQLMESNNGAQRTTYQPPNYGEIFEAAQFADLYRLANNNPYLLSGNNNSARNRDVDRNNYGYAHAPYADIFRHPNYANMYRATNAPINVSLNRRNETNLRNANCCAANDSEGDVSGASGSDGSGNVNLGEENIAYGYDEAQFPDSYQENNYDITEEEEMDGSF
ncbi:hypothetical protein AK88_03568 [Plasmodium fragile]|uniref:Uncharacterized protein n=1 Tax=Plasmodium fragile TaxID=5857 RepID=A0A0D9QIA0_PLAFR|nr:uncharacterized protein AK88_03568 [Plasmodium fragile]KJP86754.1 hypothetical protein AK88_03568 [Plasmodium fragile]